MTVGERIKAKRIKLGLTQEELAKKMGYKGKSIICKYETVGDNLTMETVENFAKHLNTTPGELLGWEKEKKTEVPEFDPDHIELIDLYSKLTKEQKQTVINMLRSFVN